MIDICTLVAIIWCRLLGWPCCPLMVATGIVGACGMLLSMVTVTCPGTFAGAERVEGGAGAMGRLGMVGFSGGFMSPSEKERGTAGARCAGGAATVTGAPGGTGWCGANICTCG